ncbi:MAG: D-glycero-alpha-D-manno-heptose-1,7-bisphosphate 7-phosphatase [Chthoniobacterales bacterium]
MGEHSLIRRAVFLDRDGVLNRPVIREGKPYPPANVSELELCADVAEGCARLKAAGFLLVVVTNQPDVGRGTQPQSTVEEIHHALRLAIPSLDRIEVCYHGGADYGTACDCRKPRPGMILQAALDLEIDLQASYMIGDRWRDIDCARAAGCRAILIDWHYAESLSETPDVIVEGFSEAVDVVLRETPVAVSSRNSNPPQRS